MADLSTAQGRRLVQDRLRDESDPVELLVNNAGYGLGDSYLQADPTVEEAMFEVNAHAVLSLTRTAAVTMANRGSGSIINVSSVAAWVPRGTYAATKAFVLALSEVCRAGGGAVRGAGAGPVPRADAHGVPCPVGQRRPTRTPGLLWLSPERVVDESLKALEKGRIVCVPGRRWRLMMLGNRLMPARLSVALARRGSRRPS